MTKARRFSGAIMQTHLRAPGVLPGGCFKRRGVIGGFLFCVLLFALTLKTKAIFQTNTQKIDFQKKGLKTHCLRGQCARNQKKSKLNQRQNGPIWANLSPARAWIWGVIGNKCRKTRVLTMASLVTNARKGVF